MNYSTNYPRHYHYPQPIPLAISQTAQVYGQALRSKGPFEEKKPWVLVRMLGLIPIFVGLGMLLYSLVPALLSSDFYTARGPGGYFIDNFGVIIVSLSLIAVGGWMRSLNKWFSDVIWITLRGEVYGSKLGTGTKSSIDYLDSTRYSMVSEIRLEVRGITVFTKIRRKEHEIQHPCVATSRIMKDYQYLIGEISNNILPKVLLQQPTKFGGGEPIVEVPPRGYSTPTPAANVQQNPPPPPDWT
jgi:hypothetical protein